MKKNNVTLFLVLGLITSCVNLMGGNTVRETHVDPGTGERTYRTTYPFLLNNGLVKIHEEPIMYSLQSRYPEVCKQMKITVERNAVQQVVVTAKFKKECSDIWQANGSICGSKDEPRFPMEDDTVCKDGLKDKCTVRAGNRLNMKLKTPADYHIQVPQDADLKVDVTRGDIHYTSDSRIPTKLSVQSSTVTYWGDNGSSRLIDQTLMECLRGETPKRIETWDYFWGSSENPKTTLKTKEGHVTLPPLNTVKPSGQTSGTARFLLWLMGARR